jgi:hypothetical protein
MRHKIMEDETILQKFCVMIDVRFNTVSPFAIGTDTHKIMCGFKICFGINAFETETRDLFCNEN